MYIHHHNTNAVVAVGPSEERFISALVQTEKVQQCELPSESTKTDINRITAEARVQCY